MVVFSHSIKLPLRVWFSGRMRPCQGRDRSSILLTRTRNERSESLFSFLSDDVLENLFTRTRSEESGCSISVVYMFWEHEGRVRFPAPRPKNFDCIYFKILRIFGKYPWHEVKMAGFPACKSLSISDGGQGFPAPRL